MNRNNLLLLLGAQILWGPLQVTGRDFDVIKKHATDVCKLNERSIYKTQKGWCCTCPGGFYVENDCSFGNPIDTTCKPCANAFDFNEQSYKCIKPINETSCKQLNNTHYFTGTPNEPSRCECDEGFYSNSKNVDHGCDVHSSCPPGFQPSELGNASSDTKCEECPPGTFSDVYSSILLCKTFSKCEPDQIVNIEGSRRSDAICSNPTTNPPQTIGTSARLIFDTTKTRVVIAQFGTFSLVVLICLGIAALVGFFISLLCLCRYKKRWEKNHRNRDLSAENPSLDTGQCPPNGNCEGNERQKPFEKNECDGQSKGNDSEKGLLLSKSSGCGNIEDSMDNRAEMENIVEKTKTSDILQVHTEGRGTSNNKKSISHRCNSCIFTGKCNMVLYYPENPEQMAEMNDNGNVTIVDKIIGRVCHKKNCELNEVPRGLIIECLNESKLADPMIKCLKKHSTNDVKKYVRKFLNEAEIENVEYGNQRDMDEMKYQWLHYITKKLGRQLTPLLLLHTECKLQIFKDNMIDVFVDKFLEQ